MQAVLPLDERLFSFAANVRAWLAIMPPQLRWSSDGKQLYRSSGSMGANYLESQEGLSRRDFLKHMRIARKEARETVYWLRLLVVQVPNDCKEEGNALLSEAQQILKIFSAIIIKVEKSNP